MIIFIQVTVLSNSSTNFVVMCADVADISATGLEILLAPVLAYGKLSPR
jgi:anti-anti-sigma regulatory factor